MQVALYGTLTKEVLRRKAAKQYDDESLILAEKLLEQNPEVYTVWNYRREALEDVLNEGGEAAKKAGDRELKLTETALRKNPKSYAAWHHRRWLVQKGLSPLDFELNLIEKLLEVDERNFHAWGYRRFVTELMGRASEEEEAYTRQRIDANFSNYSAWHTRSALLQQMYGSIRTISLQDLLAEPHSGPPPPPGVPAVPTWVLKEELGLLEQAFFTDPEDQSAWLYHRWLLGNALSLLISCRGTPQEAATLAEVGELLEKEAGKCDELLGVEPDRAKCKWALLTKARLRELQLELASDAPSESGWRDEIRQLYRELSEIDPLRKGYYQDCLQGKAHVALRAAAAAQAR